MAGRILSDEMNNKIFFWYRFMSFFSRLLSKRMDFMNLGYYNPDFKVPHKLHEIDSEESRLRQVSLYAKLFEEFEPGLQKSLEVGSGFGGGCYLLHEYYGIKNVLGVDKISSSVADSNKKYKNPGKIEFKQFSSDTIDQLNSKFDVVVCLEASQHFPDWLRFYENVHKVLEDTGVFVYGDIFDIRDIPVAEELIKKAGLVIQKKEDLSPGVINSISKMAPLTGFYGWCEARVLGKHGIDFSRESKFYKLLSKGDFRFMKFVITKA